MSRDARMILWAGVCVALGWWNVSVVGHWWPAVAFSVLALVLTADALLPDELRPSSPPHHPNYCSRGYAVRAVAAGGMPLTDWAEPDWVAVSVEGSERHVVERFEVLAEGTDVGTVVAIQMAVDGHQFPQLGELVTEPFGTTVGAMVTLTVDVCRRATPLVEQELRSSP